MKQSEFLPTTATFVIAIEAASKHRRSEYLSQLWNELTSVYQLAPDVNAYVAMIEGYVRCNEIMQAIQMLNAMSGDGIPITVRSYLGLVQYMAPEIFADDPKLMKELDSLKVLMQKKHNSGEEIKPNEQKRIDKFIASLQEAIGGGVETVETVETVEAEASEDITIEEEISEEGA